MSIDLARIHLNRRPSLFVVFASILVGCGPAEEPKHLRQASEALAGGQPGTPFPVSGKFTFALAPVSVRAADGNTFIDFKFNEELSGSIQGTRSGTGTLRLHPDGTFTVADTGFLTSTIPGVVGSVNVEAWAEGTFASFNGSVTVYGQTGTGAFAGLQGVVKITGAATGPATLAGTYDGQLHF